MISGTTDIYAVIGDPIEHSLSPVLQNYFMHIFDLDAAYMALQVRPPDLHTALSGMQAMNFKGINVTIPHKTDVLKYCTQCSKLVQTLGAANTLTFSTKGIQADVTDPFGFIESMADRKSLFLNANVCILGAGGAARSVLLALSKLSCAQVYIYNRTREKAELLTRESKSFGLEKVSVLSQHDLHNAIEFCSILINTTSVGMYPQIEQCPVDDNMLFSENQFVYDLVYSPVNTRLVQMAAAQGAVVQNGLDMLIFQGLQSLRIWTGLNLVLTAQQLKRCQTILKDVL